VNFSTTVSLIALVVSVLSALAAILSVWYTHAARAAKAQTDAAKQQAAAAKAQLSLDQDRRNDELARRRKEEEEAARADLRVTTIWVRPHPPQIVLHNLGPHVASEISLSYLDADDASRRQTRHVGMNWRPRFDQNGQAAWMLTLA
jgi:hypothetical protein